MTEMIEVLDGPELDAFIDAHLKETVLRADSTRLDAVLFRSILREFAHALYARGTISEVSP